MITPGSRLEIDHPKQWYATVVHKVSGKQWTYWINGNHLNRESVANFVAVHFPNVTPITIDQGVRAPEKILQRVPADHYECGSRIAALGLDKQAEIEAETRRIVNRPLSQRLLPLSQRIVPLSQRIKPISQRLRPHSY